MTDLVYPSEPAPLFPRPSIDRPGKSVIPRGEMLPLIDDSLQVFGQAARAWCHGGSRALHPVVHLHIIDRESRIYLQRRSRHKSLLPGYWDAAVGGHIGYGEQALEALYREAQEELGLTRFNPAWLQNFVYESRRERELVMVYAMVGHPELHPDPSEVWEGRWWTIPEIEENYGHGILTPNLEQEFLRIKDQLLALL